MPVNPRLDSLLRTEPATRRSLLRHAGLAAVAVGAGAGLAGCAGSDPESPPSAGNQPTESAPGDSDSPGAEDSPSPESSPTGESNPPDDDGEMKPQGASVPAAEVPEGSGVVVQEKYVVTQPAAGEYKAFSAICTHQGCPVDRVENAEIVCPCHGSHFAIDSGDPVAGPAEKPLTAATVTLSGDELVVTD